MNKLRFKKYYLYNLKKELLYKKIEKQEELENKNAKKLVLKLY